MKLRIEHDTLFLNNQHFCWVEAGNGRGTIESGTGKVFTKYSPEHERVLAYSTAHGWIGAYPECDIVLGRVRHRTGLLPSVAELDRLVYHLEEHEFGDGEQCTLRV